MEQTNNNMGISKEAAETVQDKLDTNVLPNSEEIRMALEEVEKSLDDFDINNELITDFQKTPGFKKFMEELKNI